MSKGVCESSGPIHFQKQMGDTDIWKLPIEIEYQRLRFVRYGGCQSFDLQCAILDRPTGDGSAPGSPRQTFQAVGDPRLSIRKPWDRIKSHVNLGMARTAEIGTRACFRSA